MPIHDLASPAGAERSARRVLLDRLREKNEAHLASRADNSELAARIASYELAFKMQQSAPEAVDFGASHPKLWLSMVWTSRVRPISAASA